MSSVLTRFYRRLIAVAGERFAAHVERLKQKREATAMGRTVAAKLAGLPADRQERVHARAKELIVEDLTLQQLRKARNKSQVAVARKLNISQDTVSRYERQADLLLLTLQRYVEAVDGKLSLLVEFPDRKPIGVPYVSVYNVTCCRYAISWGLVEAQEADATSAMAYNWKMQRLNAETTLLNA